MSTNEVRYRTLRCIKIGLLDWPKVIGVITVATCKDEITGAFIAGIAYSKPKHFRRKMGQQIAFYRMDLHEHVFVKDVNRTVKEYIITKCLDREISFVRDADLIV